MFIISQCFSALYLFRENLCFWVKNKFFLQSLKLKFVELSKNVLFVRKQDSQFHSDKKVFAGSQFGQRICTEILVMGSFSVVSDIRAFAKVVQYTVDLVNRHCIKCTRKIISKH